MTYKRLKKTRGFKISKVTIISSLVFIIAIGYAIIQNTFGFVGNVKVAAGYLDFYFDNLVIANGSKEATIPAEIDKNDRTKISFELNFDHPDDFYQFSVDIVNDKKIDAMITNINISGIPEELKKYFNYHFCYFDGQEIEANDFIPRMSRIKTNFYISFNNEENLIDILGPDSLLGSHSLTLNIDIDFGQSTNNAITKSHNLYTIINSQLSGIDNLKSKFVTSNNGINFAEPSSDTNGKGVYLKADTKGDEYPILYYRGDVENNNVLFADKCWKIVRTTEDGGTKLIYNGTPNYDTSPIEESEYIDLVNDVSYPFSFNLEKKEWESTNHDKTTESTVEFKIEGNGHYYFNYVISHGSYFNYAIVYVNNVQKEKLTGEATGSIDLGDLTADTAIKVIYHRGSSASYLDDNVSFSINKLASDANPNCDNVGIATQIGSNLFSGGTSSLQYSGYMYSKATYSSSTIPAATKSTANIIYANDVTWDGTNYTLSGDTYTSTGNWSDDYSNIANKHHYTCREENVTTCSTIYYITITTSSNAYHVSFTDGVTIEKAINNMFPENNSDRNYYTSISKSTIDSWYKEYILKYKNKLNDTIWCNDRTIYDYAGFSKNGNSNYNPVFKANKRLRTEYKPSLACENKNDGFTVKDIVNGNGRLTYPIGMLTADEAVLAGSVTSTNSSSSTTYLTTGKKFWTMTPYFYNANLYNFAVDENGCITGHATSSMTNNGIRPSIVIDKSSIVVNGDGTKDRPFIIS